MSFLKGWFGEIKAILHMWSSLDRQVYHRFHNIIIPSSNGSTQIDHIIVSIYGIFVVETKNKSGWIFGSENKANWTQVIYGKKYSFQNPLLQVYRQKKFLSQLISVDSITKIQTVIYFSGDCKFKTQLPSNVINYGLGRYIKSFVYQRLSHDEISRVITILEEHNNKSQISTSDHVRSLQERHSSNIKCPNCGSGLRIKEAKKGKKPGLKFLGCENYPKCRFTKIF